MEDALEIDHVDLSPEPHQVPRRPRGIGLAGVCLSIVVGLQLIPGGGPPPVEPVLARNRVPVEVPSEFQWEHVQGLDRFESMTEPLTTLSGYMAVANPWGASLAASVVVSKDGTQWNRWGTIHGVGGETEIHHLATFAGQYVAIGTYTESLPKHDFAINERIPAVWTSENAINWEMTSVPKDGDSPILVGRDPAAVILTQLASQNPEIDMEALRKGGDLEYFGSIDKLVAMVRTALTPTVLTRPPGMRGDPFARRVDIETRTLLISLDQVIWMSEVVPFDDIRFNGGVGGALLVSTTAGEQPEQLGYWLIRP